MKSPHQGLKRIFYAAKYSYQGFKATWQGEAAFRQEVVLLLLLMPVVYLLAESIYDWVLLIGVVLFVMVVELLNSALETLVDRIDPDYHPMAGKAKDQASAAVMLSIVMALLVWGAFIVNKLFAA